MVKTQKIALLLLLIFGTICQSLTMFRSGLHYFFGIGFWGPNGHDGLWHLALINQISTPFKIPHPTFSGQFLQNYHPFYDILVSFLTQISNISPSTYYFQILPLIFALLLGVLSFILGRRLTNSINGGFLLTFFNYFAGSFGWLVTFIRDQNFYGESLFWAMQPSSTQINPPFALSLILLLLGILLLTAKPTKTSFILLLLLLVFLPITKSYAGITFYLILLFYLLYNKNQRLYLCKLFLFSLPFTLLLFLLYNPHSGNLFQLQPFWFIHTLLESPDRLYLPQLASLRYNLHFYDPRYLAIELIGLLAFLIGNFALRSLALIKLRQNLSNPLLKSLFSTLILTCLLPLLFVQKGTAWNSIQFLYYSLFLANIFLCLTLIKLKSVFLVILVVVLSLISNLGTYQNYLGFPPPAALPIAELTALQFLSRQTGSIVLTYPYDPFSRSIYYQTPIPLYAYETTAYVSAFSQKQSFLEDEMNLSISGYGATGRRSQVSNFFDHATVFEQRGFLVNNQIDYIYLTANQITKFNPDLLGLGLSPIYNQGQIVIYKVER